MQAKQQNTTATDAAHEKEERMGRIVVTQYVSLDGVMEGPGGITILTLRPAASSEVQR